MCYFYYYYYYCLYYYHYNIYYYNIYYYYNNYILINDCRASRLQSQAVDILDLRTPKVGLKYRKSFVSLLCFF